MSKKMADHLHKYKKVDIGSNGKEYHVYRCMKPGCNHYIPISQAEGRVCECNRCGEPMIITKQSLWGSSGRAMARPHCPDCTKRKGKVKDENVAAIAAFLEGNKTQANSN